MSVIEAASAGVKDLADGSLRITLEFTPLVAKEAYALFGARGTPIAVCALKEGFAQAKDAPKEKLGPLCLLAVRWCGEPEFQQWMHDHFAEFSEIPPSERTASAQLKETLEIESRRELDTDPEAADKFHKLIRIPYSKYLEDK